MEKFQSDIFKPKMRNLVIMGYSGKRSVKGMQITINMHPNKTELPFYKNHFHNYNENLLTSLNIVFIWFIYVLHFYHK